MTLIQLTILRQIRFKSFLRAKNSWDHQKKRKLSDHRSKCGYIVAPDFAVFEDMFTDKWWN